MQQSRQGDPSVVDLLQQVELWNGRKSRTPGKVEDVRIRVVEHLQLLDHLEMLCIVRLQYGLDADSPCLTVLFRAEHAEYIGIGPRGEDAKHRRTVHVLQGREVVVAQSQLVLRLHKELVVPPGVSYIMANRRHKQRKAVDPGGKLQYSAEHGTAEDAMQHVAGVPPVVVRVLVPVLLCHRVQEVCNDLWFYGQVWAGKIQKQPTSNSSELRLLQRQDIKEP
mmetsp:Transcript_45546/g.126760  ORF Transcript_45546/g.126760 Transcript_45546/m.126760 type:complete len:222 (+) Transcript_45546:816-1481(+)